MSRRATFDVQVIVLCVQRPSHSDRAQGTTSALEGSGDGVSVLQPGCARPRRAARSIRRDGNRHAPPLSPRSPLQIHYGAPTGEVQKYTRVTITSHPSAFLDLELPLNPDLL